MAFEVKPKITVLQPMYFGYKHLLFKVISHKFLYDKNITTVFKLYNFYGILQ